MAEDTALRVLIDELTADHQRVTLVKGQPVEGLELPLLSQLYEARSSDSGTPDGGPGGGGTPGNVIDPDAVALWTCIQREVEEGHRRVSALPVPYYGDQSVTTMMALRMWFREVSQKGAPMAQMVDLYTRALTWVQDIRAHLEPEKRVAMRGVACTECGAKTHKDADSKTRTPAILLIYTRPAPVAVCRACGKSWSGGELVDLGSGQAKAPEKR